MDFKDSFRDKNVTVLGLARSGESAVELLSKLGANVLVSDQKDEKQLKDTVDRLRDRYPRIRFYLGGHPGEVIEGADLIVISPGVPISIPVLESAREKGIPVIGEVELAYRVCRAPIIAITGTKGKSTTSTLLGHILSEHVKENIEVFGQSPISRVIVAGNIGIPISKYVLDLTESDLLVLEVSSFQLETTAHFAPKVSVILNIVRDHLDRYNSVEDYANAKYRIFANQTESDYTILNADDPLTLACKTRTQAKVVLFSSRQKLDNGVYLEDSKIVAKVGQKGKTIICGRDDLLLPGRHNLENALSAMAVSIIYGVSSNIIRKVLKSFSGLEHALELVDEVDGIKFVDDSKSTNVVSLKAALESLDGRIILIMGGRDKGNDYTSLVDLIREKVPHLIAIGESAEKIQSSIGIYSNSYKAETLEDAVFTAYKLAKRGDYVLLSPACASFDMFQDYAERGRRFKEVVREISKSSVKR